MPVKRKRVMVIGTLIVVLFILVGECVGPLIPRFVEKNLSKEDYKSKKESASKEYVALFHPFVRKALRFDLSEIFKSKHPYLSFEYYDHYIIVNKINAPVNKPLSQWVSIERGCSEMSSRVSYSGYEAYSIKFLTSALCDSLVDKFYLRYDKGLLGKTEIGDTVVNYNLSITNMSFRYEKDADVDVLFEIERNAGKEHKELNVLFYKKGLYVYVIVVYPPEKEDAVKRNYPMELLFGKAGI